MPAGKITSANYAGSHTSQPCLFKDSLSRFGDAPKELQRQWRVCVRVRSATLARVRICDALLAKLSYF